MKAKVFSVLLGFGLAAIAGVAIAGTVTTAPSIGGVSMATANPNVWICTGCVTGKNGISICSHCEPGGPAA